VSTWIFLRGLTRESAHWGDFAEAWRKRFEPSRVVCVDLPGNGANRALRSAVSVRAMVAACRGTLIESGVPPPYRILGLSLGAMVAVDWASRHPEEISGAMLVSTSLGGFGSWYQRLRVQSWGRLIALLLARDPLHKEQVILRLTSHRRLRDSGPLMEQWVAIREARPVSTSNAIRQLFAAARFRAPPSAPTVPLLVLASSADELVDSGCSVRMARAWNAELGLHRSAGHDIPLDDPEWVMRAAKTWLQPWRSPGAGESAPSSTTG
jgi:pimeloyl-ACP methyl ester carboxylesterase